MPAPRRKPAPHSAARLAPASSRRRIQTIPRRTRFSLAIRLGSLCAAALAALVLWAWAARSYAPRANTSRQNFDVIIVLGTPADSDGNPTPQMLDRVTEAVQEYQRGVAPRLILTGSAAHNRFVEADVMAAVAQAQGVPASAILEEPRALDTLQNACYSTGILKSHGWHSAEIVSSPAHLPRASMIFSRLPLEWRTHAAPGNLQPGSWSHAADLVETLKTARYLVWSQWADRCPM